MLLLLLGLWLLSVLRLWLFNVLRLWLFSMLRLWLFSVFRLLNLFLRLNLSSGFSKRCWFRLFLLYLLDLLFILLCGLTLTFGFLKLSLIDLFLFF